MGNAITDIILILYGDRADLDRCVASIKEHCHDYNILIHDNNRKNIGFTAACNKLIESSTGKYCWLLNQDAILINSDSQQALIDRLESDDKIGAVGSQQLDPKNPDRIAFGGTPVGPGSCFPAGRHLGGLVSMGHCRIPMKVTWLNGASMMFSRRIYEEIGPLDDDLFLLYSDSDYSYRIRQAGYSCYYEPASKVYHTLGKASKSSAEWQQKDMAAFMKKWGIQALPDGRFIYSREFQKLDMFP